MRKDNEEKKKNNRDLTQRLARARWSVLDVAIVTLLALSYGTLQTNQAVATPSSGDASVLISIEGMSCSACVARVKKTLKKLDGVSEANVNLEKRNAEILYDPEKVSPETLAKSIAELGYKAETPQIQGKSQ
jgi:copper chaperone CopZ